VEAGVVAVREEDVLGAQALSQEGQGALDGLLGW
jgi:hypothetical protein